MSFNASPTAHQRILIAQTVAGVREFGGRMKKEKASPGTFPFGKYKGKPYDVVVKDAGYCKWLLRQQWFNELDHNEAWSKIAEVWGCGLCNNHPEGMYAGEGDYMKCVGCGNGT